MMKNLKWCFLFFLFYHGLLWSQVGEVSGKVISSKDGEPLPGVNVMIKGTFLGSATDSTGYFLIPGVPAGPRTIIASCIGYQQKEIKLEIVDGERKKLLIKMEPTILEIQEIVVTGSRRSQNKIESTVSITSLTSDEVNFRNPVTIDEVMGYIPGVQMVESQINIRGSTGYARGTGNRVILLVDGLPLLSYDNGLIYWDALPITDIKRVEVMKGPGSALYGSNAMGGVINILTSDLPLNKKFTRIIIQEGYFSPPALKRERWTNEPLLTTTWRLQHLNSRGKLAVLTGIGQQNSKGYHEGGWFNRYLFTTRMQYHFSRNRIFTTRLHFIDDLHGTFTQWRDAAHRFHTPLDARKDRIFTNKLQFASIYKNVPSPTRSSTYKLNYFFTHFKNDIHNNQSSSFSHLLMVENQYDVKPGANFYLIYGSQLQGGLVRSNIWGSHRGMDGALFMQMEWKPTKGYILSLGNRIDFHQIDRRPVEIQINPKFGLNYHWQERFSLYFSAGSGYRAPSLAELFIDSRQGIFEVKPNPELKAERSISEEMGLLYRTTTTEISFSLFNTDYFELIEPVQDPEDKKIHFVNITRAKISGTEFSFIWQMRKLPIRTSISYTFLYPQNLTTQRILSYRHEHVVLVEQQIALVGGLRAGWNYRFLSRIRHVELFKENRQTGADQRVPIHLLDCFLSWQPLKSLELNLSIKNLLQYYYVTVERNMGPLRETSLRLNYTF